MSNITEALSQRAFLIPKADFTTESHKEIINFILNKHGEKYSDEVKLIDENDDYDSFFVKIYDKAYCIKLSFDSSAIYYEHMILKGIENLNISPIMFDRNEIDFGKKIYYTIQSYDFSTNLNDIGPSLILNNDYKDFNTAISLLHCYEIPDGVENYLDDTEAYLNYHNINFNSILSYIEETEKDEYEFIKILFQETYDDMFNLFKLNKNKIQRNKLTHGNLNSRSIIINNGIFKFINYENTFIGNPFFDLVNLVFELQMSGIKEHDFITKKISEYKLSKDRFRSGILIEEYKICKEIWTRKKFIDLIISYVKEVLILNKTRTFKMAKLSNDFSNHFYRFEKINSFSKNKDILINKFTELMRDY